MSSTTRNNTRIDELCWHDGNIVALGINGNPPRSAFLSCELYENLEESTRGNYRFEFINISRIILSADIEEMERNKSAGSISDGSVTRRNGEFKIRLFITGGYIEIICNNIAMSSDIT